MLGWTTGSSLNDMGLKKRKAKATRRSHHDDHRNAKPRTSKTQFHVQRHRRSHTDSQQLNPGHCVQRREFRTLIQHFPKAGLAPPPSAKQPDPKVSN